MKPTAPLRKQVQSVCHDTLPWLISFSLDLTMPFRATIVFLISVVAMSVAQEPNKEPKDAGRGLRNMFFTTFSGVRVIDTDWASLSERRSKYFELFDAAQDVLTQLRMVSGPDMK